MAEQPFRVKTVVSQGQLIACLKEEGLLIHDGQSALDLFMSLAWQTEASRLALPMSCLSPTFFDLRSGVLGEVLQKVVNYRLKLAVWGNFSGFTSQALRAFMAESNRGNAIWFCSDERAAIAALSRPD